MADVVAEIGVLDGSGPHALPEDACTIEVRHAAQADDWPVADGGALAVIHESRRCALARDGLRPDPELS